MKLKKFLTRLLCFILISASLFLTYSCTSLEDTNDSEFYSDSDSNSNSNSDSGSSDAPSNQNSANTSIVLSGTPAFRIIYASAYKSLAQKVSNKLIGLDKSYVKDSGKYTISQDSTKEDGTPEILIGLTNRDATSQAKKLLVGKTNHYAIYVTSTAIAIYATAEEGIEAGVTAFLKKVSEKDGAVVYDNSKGNITGKYTVEIPETEAPPSAQTKTPAKTDIDGDALLNALKSSAGSKAWSVAVSTTDGIQVASIRNTNPQNTYSVSKVFCVTAIGMLYDEGRIKTNETIGEIFKDEIKAYGIDANRWKNITVHDVLKHQVGFKKGGLLDIDADPSLMDKHDDFLKVVLSYELDGNKTYKYTDAAYYLISRIVAKKSGVKLDVYLKTRLFNVAEYKNYTIVKCPQGHPIGATQFFLRPEDVVKLGRIYLDGGMYKGNRIISQEWVNIVIERGYELKSSNTGYGKGGMRGQYLYVNFKHNVAVAWLSETDSGTSNLGGKLAEYMR